MTLTHKERLRRALLHQPIDRVPTQVNYTAVMGRKLAAHFNAAVADLPRVLNNHFVRLDLTYPGRLSDDGRVRFDWWGAGHATGEEGYYIPVNPLRDSKDLNGFPWPDPHAPHLLDEATQAINAYGDEYFIAPNFGFALFERAWSLRGFEQIFIDLGRDPDFVGALLDRVASIQLDHTWLVENFKDKLSFYGGVSTQTVLPYGSPAEVQAAVRQCVRQLAPEGTGLLIGPSHRMMADIPLGNVEAMLAASREL